YIHITTVSALSTHPDPEGNIFYPHNYNLNDGILGGHGPHYMYPLCTMHDHGVNGIRGVWCVPAGHVKMALAHVMKKWGANRQPGQHLAILVIPTNDVRLRLFRNYLSGSHYSRTVNPVYSPTQVPVTDADFFIIDPDSIPIQLHMIRMSGTFTVPFRTPDQIRATAAAYRNSPRGRAVRAAYRNSPEGRAVRAAWLNAHPNYAAAYRNSPRGRAVIADYYAANRERIAAYRAAYRNSPEGRAVIADYYAANRERIAAYRAANSERSAAYRAANRGRIAVRDAASYAAKRAKKYGWNVVDQDNADADRPLDERVAGVRTDVEGSERRNNKRKKED
ncbi:hypothetical protein TrRE_jg8508, partial [Triparma retinervis]